MKLVGFLLGLAILCLLATQLSFGLQQQIAVKRKNSEGDEEKELAISDTLGLTEQEKELEKEILSSEVVKPVANLETDSKKAKKAKKLKKLKKQKKRLAALRKLALKRQAEQRKRQAEQKKRQQEREEARENARRGYIKKRGDATCFDGLEQHPKMSKLNCSTYKAKGFCKIPFLKSRMMQYCRRTCEFCVAAAPPIRRSCHNTKFGCCWDKDVPAKGPNNEGCAPCVNQYVQLCQQFRHKCGDMTENGAWVRRRCPAKCRVCEQSPEMKELQRQKMAKLLETKLVSTSIKERYQRKEKKAQKERTAAKKKSPNKNKKRKGRPRNGSS
uniref:Toxin candidate TRINITY_DN21156_c5_g1_i3 n=1 Tax=Isarachnanthus nocturnus TaxID=1240238 RepID=A0A7G7WZ39_9CNID|nr:toxin candidate TRINITY_DN21156_c5_g1_i3 [Isarachnanthus nocturnus]